MSVQINSPDADAHNRTMLLARFHRIARNLRAVARMKDTPPHIERSIRLQLEQFELDLERLHRILER